MKSRLQLAGMMLALAGCALLPHRTTVTPMAQVTLPSGAKVQQGGDAAKPATVSTSSTVSTVPLPPATSLIFDEKKPGQLQLNLGAVSEFRSETHTERAEAPQAFTPPAPPTPTEMAQGKTHLWFWLGMAGGAAASLFGLVRGWDFVMYGGGAVAAACAFALFAQSHPLVFALIGVGVAIAVAGPYFWHTSHKDNPALNPPKP